jgi:hypothetical protein
MNIKFVLVVFFFIQKNPLEAQDSNANPRSNINVKNLIVVPVSVVCFLVLIGMALGLSLYVGIELKHRRMKEAHMSSIDDATDSNIVV